MSAVLLPDWSWSSCCARVACHCCSRRAVRLSPQPGPAHSLVAARCRKPAGGSPGRAILGNESLGERVTGMDQRLVHERAPLPEGEGKTDALYAPQLLGDGIAVLAAQPLFSRILESAGTPRFRRRRNGFGTLLHIILEQQVSIDAAAAMYHRLLGLCRPFAPRTFLLLDDATLRSCGFSRQKMSYARELALAVESG